MAINIKDITKLQSEVRKDIAGGAPGRKGTFGCCALATDDIRQADGPHRSASLEDRIKRFQHPQTKRMSTAQFKEAAQEIMGFTKPPVQTKAPTTRLRFEPGNGLQYTSDEIRQLIANDLNAKGIDMGVVRVTFNDQGAIVQPVG